MRGKPRFLAEDGGEISGGKTGLAGKLGHGKGLRIAPYHPPQRAGDGGPGPGPCHLERYAGVRQRAAEGPRAPPNRPYSGSRDRAGGQDKAGF
ncbi:conserved protein [Tepidicaulis marinus]|uniref:Conserved protein n=1 Tax=Tepidicaulis marinus TaxID=1333998 RepID=A0A081B6A6_9HYPH|nr:conserved protein [Tepidicaulis marinus]